MTIFRMAKALDSLGYWPHFLKMGDGGLNLQDIERLSMEYTDVELSTISNPSKLQELPAGFGAIATFWTTAYVVSSMKQVVNKGYLVQDWEPGFYASGSLSLAAKQSYQLGLTHIANTKPIAEKLQNYSGGQVVILNPTVDKDKFYAGSEVQSRKRTVCAYWRPSHKRNCSELLSVALNELLKKDNEVTVYLVGEDIPLPKAMRRHNRIQQLGVLRPEETAKLYRECLVGVALMDTPHPSYLPFELMASGCVPVTTHNPDTDWLFQDGVNAIVTSPTGRSLAQGIIRALDERDKLIPGIQSTIDGLPTWDEELSSVALETVSSWDNQRRGEP